MLVLFPLTGWPPSQWKVRMTYVHLLPKRHLGNSLTMPTVASSAFLSSLATVTWSRFLLHMWCESQLIVLSFGFACLQVKFYCVLASFNPFHTSVCLIRMTGLLVTHTAFQITEKGLRDDSVCVCRGEGVTVGHLPGSLGVCTTGSPGNCEEIGGSIAVP